MMAKLEFVSIDRLEHYVDKKASLQVSARGCDWLACAVTMHCDWLHLRHSMSLQSAALVARLKSEARHQLQLVTQTYSPALLRKSVQAGTVQHCASTVRGPVNIGVFIVLLGVRDWHAEQNTAFTTALCQMNAGGRGHSCLPKHGSDCAVQAPVDIIGVVTAAGPLGSVKRKSDATELARRDITLTDQRCVWH